MRREVLLMILALMIPLSISQVSSQPNWDLSIRGVTLFPQNAEVQQGQPLLITIYVGNNEAAQFSGTVTVSLYVDGFLRSKEDWQIGNPSLGSVPIPSGGYRTIVTSLNTSTLTIGVHELRIEVKPKGYADPRMGDNTYSLNFIVVPLVNPFIDMESELVQGSEHEIAVHVPNPRSDPLKVSVRLFVNGSEVGTREVYVPPKSIYAAKFYYMPKAAGRIQVDALLLEDDRLMNKASVSATVRPSCDLGIAGAQIGKRIFAGEPASGKLRIYNKGLSESRANLTIVLDSEPLETKELGPLEPGSEEEIEFALGTLDLGSHVVTFRIDPLDAIDLNTVDNELSVSLRVIPVPVSISSRVTGRDVHLNVTNLADVVANLEISIERNGSEIRRMNLTLEAGESEDIDVRGLDPGNYTIVVYSRGSVVASTEVSVEGGLTSEAISPLWLVAMIPIVATLVYYLVYMRKRRKWPS